MNTEAIDGHGVLQDYVMKSHERCSKSIVDYEAKLVRKEEKLMVYSLLQATLKLELMKGPVGVRSLQHQ